MISVTIFAEFGTPKGGECEGIEEGGKEGEGEKRKCTNFS